MAHIALHPRPRPAELSMRDWFIPVRSTAGGRVAERDIRVRYQHPRPDSPGRMQRDGVILITFTIVWTLIAGLLLWAIGPQVLFHNTFGSVNDILLAVVPVAFLASWWTISIRMFMKAAAGRRGQRVIQGTVVERSTKSFEILREDQVHTYTRHYLAIDDGTSDLVEGWEVPAEVWNVFSLGQAAEAFVSGDGRYPYYIAHL